MARVMYDNHPSRYWTINYEYILAIIILQFPQFETLRNNGYFKKSIQLFKQKFTIKYISKFVISNPNLTL